MSRLSTKLGGKLRTIKLEYLFQINLFQNLRGVGQSLGGGGKMS